jgi:hypothetical protein
MRTVIAARARERTGPAPTRYLSKNNANIARLSLLADLFPDCRILVPLREPLSHCRSLARQHRRFVKLHAGEPFARQYMSWIGHFEFGADLRPIDFGDAGRDGYANDPLRLDFWLRYWISAQKAILRAGHGVIRLDYGMLRAEPAQSLRALAEALEVGDAGALMRQAHRVHPPIDDIANNDDATADDPSLLCRATELYDESRHQCINPNVA